MRRDDVLEPHMAFMLGHVIAGQRRGACGRVPATTHKTMRRLASDRCMECEAVQLRHGPGVGLGLVEPGSGASTATAKTRL